MDNEQGIWLNPVRLRGQFARMVADKAGYDSKYIEARRGKIWGWARPDPIFSFGKRASSVNACARRRVDRFIRATCQA
jgi:hypothetical protein